MHTNYYLLPALMTLFFVQGCSNNASIFSRDNIPLVHRIDIQQGNVIDQNMLAQLKPGMEKKKVLFIMGSPLIKDTFHTERWDYVYTYKEGRKPHTQRRVTLFFKDNKLSRIGGDVHPARGQIPIKARSMEKVEVPEADPDTLFSAVKRKLTSGNDEPLISDEPETDKQDVQPASKTESSSDTEKATGSLQVSDTEEEEEAVETDDHATAEIPEEEVDEEDTTETGKGGLFDKFWGEEEGNDGLDPDDPVLSDPALNPSL